MPVAYTRDGSEWTPSYLESIDHDSCIGCGRCFKACAQGVLAPIEKPYVDDDDDDDEDMGGTVMSVASPGACIGCGACGRSCAKKAQTYITV
ncbi:MAG: ferredoxin III, nif-specific [Actinobacteria bacterium]|nr:ferredoxin III, nif-specific [Actinomycetota bacterium]MCG2808304.1 ferredoxin III, nif-specific [Coriobacteriia bacterium]